MQRYNEGCVRIAIRFIQEPNSKASLIPVYAPIHSFSQESNLLQHNMIADSLAHDGVSDAELKEMAAGIFIGTPLFSLVVLD